METNKLKFPEHICIVGKTGSGKSRLLGEILRRNHDLFERTTKENIAVVVSPHETWEIQKHIGGNSN